jgi:hypothetical protein
MLSEDRSLCRQIDRMIAVSQRAANRPIFPVRDAAAILARQHQLDESEHRELLALISRRCISKQVPLSYIDFDRVAPI